MGITSTDNSATIASTADNGPAGVQHYISPGPDGVLFVPDAHLLFSGRYGRSGSDLVINGDDGARAIVPDYFSQALPPDLYSPDGAVLTGDVVSRLAGPRFPMHFAQVGQPAGQAPIGQVETISGTATATHANGAVDTLALRSPVYAGDIIETAAGANVGITFADRTVLSVDSGTRMTLDQFVYAPGGTGNASLMNLIQGSFSFIAGQVAPTGDMRIETPVSSMSIRGTTGRAFLVANDGSTAHVLFRDPAPPGVIGALGAIDVNNKLTGALIRALRLEGEGVIVRNTAGDFEDYTPTPLQQGADQAGIALVTAAFAAQQARINAGEPVLNPIPGGQPGQPGQPVPPDPGQPQPPPQPLQQQPAPQDPSQPPPADPQRGGAAPGDGQTQLGSLDVIIDPANGAVLASIAGAVLEPIGAVRSVSLLGNEFLGLVPLLPNEFATDAATAAATGEADTSDPLSPLPPLGASLTVPGGQSVAEDGSVVISGFNVGGSGSLTVTLNASSTVTLATLTGLTFLAGDGTADSTMTFTGTADAIDAALNGLTYQPTPDHDTSGLITLSIGDGTTTVDSIVAIAITPVPDQPQVTGNIGSRSVVANGNFAVDASSVFQNIDTGSTTTYSAILQGGGALPSWLSFDATTGILSGTPPGTSTETVTVLVTATTSEGLSSSQAFTLTAAPDRVGTAGGDIVIDNDPVSNSIQGGAGNDTITIAAATGVDVVEPGTGNDIVTGNGQTIVSFVNATQGVSFNFGNGAGFVQAVLKNLATGEVTPLQVASGGVDPVDFVSSDNPVFSPDGTKVAIQSTAALVPDGPGGTWNIYVRDLATGEVTLVSSTATGGFGNNNSLATGFRVAWSPDGTKIAFMSNATNFVAGDTNGLTDIFIKDLVTGAIERVSVGTGGTQAIDTTSPAPGIPDGSWNPKFSPDGSLLLFQSTAQNFAADDTNNQTDIFLLVLTGPNAGTLYLISRDSAGVAGNGNSTDASFSPDGQTVVFVSSSINLGASGTSNSLFTKDISAVYAGDDPSNGALTELATTTGGSGAWPSFSPDGTKVLYYNLQAGGQIFYLILEGPGAGTNVLVSSNAAGVAGNAISQFAQWSADGTKVIFQSIATNLVPGDTNGAADVFVKDLTTGEIERPSVDESGAEGNAASSFPVISPIDSNLVAFETVANNLFVSGGTGNDKFSGIATVWGSSFRDALLGLNNNEVFRGNAGADIIEGRGGVDEADYSNSPAGIVVTMLNNPDPSLQGFSSLAQDGWGSNDILRQIENIRGSEFSDTITMDDFANTVWGNGGNDTISGLGGADVILPGRGSDTIDGGAGVDTLSYADSATPVVVTMSPTTPGSGTVQDGSGGTDQFSNIEIVVGSPLADSFVGSVGNDIFVGNGGADTLLGGAGDDEMHISGAGFARIDGGTGQNSLVLDGSFDLDLRNIANANFTNVQRIDLGDAGTNRLTLTFEDVFDMAGEGNIAFAEAHAPEHALIVSGGAGDTIELLGAVAGSPNAGGSWVAAGATTIDGQTHAVFDFVAPGGQVQASVAVDTQATTVVAG